MAILAKGASAYPVAYAQAEGDIHLAGGRPDDALTAYRQGRDLASELGQYSVVLDNKVRTLETRFLRHPRPTSTRMPVDEAGTAVLLVLSLALVTGCSTIGLVQ